MNIEERNKVFIDRDKLFSLIEGKTPTQNEVNEILNKALKLQGLNLEEVATLLRVEDVNTICKNLKKIEQIKTVTRIDC